MLGMLGAHQAAASREQMKTHNGPDMRPPRGPHMWPCLTPPGAHHASSSTTRSTYEKA